MKDWPTTLARLEQGAAATAAGFMRGMTMIAALFVLCAAIYAAKGAWGIVAFTLAFAAGIVALGVVASRRTSPERMAPVLRALRDAPETVTVVRHYTTSDSRRMFTTHWIEVKTADARLVVKAPDWEGILDQLRRRCPGADLSF